MHVQSSRVFCALCLVLGLLTSCGDEPQEGEQSTTIDEVEDRDGGYEDTGQDIQEDMPVDQMPDILPEDMAPDVMPDMSLDTPEDEPDASEFECFSDEDCDDNDRCTGEDFCNEGFCVAVDAPRCDDEIDCTQDACQSPDGQCLSTPNDALCPEGEICDVEAGGCVAQADCESDEDCVDNLICNGDEFCDAGTCVAGEDITCEDGIDCTVGTCDEEMGCLHTPDNTLCDITEYCDLQEGGCVARPACVRDADCDDGLFCNGAEFCDTEAGSCVAGQTPSLDDGVSCTDDACDEETDTITHQPNAGLCDDGLFCNGVEICDAEEGCFAGDLLILTDEVECTEDICDEDLDEILHLPRQVACDDNLYCNGAEVCDVEQGCIEGSAPITDDGISCTRDACDEETDTIIHAPQDALCDDQTFCNGAEICDASEGCISGRPLPIDDGIPCTNDSCDEDADVIVHTPVDSLCDDGQECSGVETCDAQLGCLDGDAPNIDDGVACTMDQCDDDTGEVSHEPVNSRCDDGLFCNGVETCDINGGCLPGTPPTLDDGVACTRDICDEETDTILHLAQDNLCDNGLFCDGAETCDEQLGCQEGRAPVIDDGVSCTRDSCDERTDTIVHTPVDSVCDNGMFCDGAETCDVQRDCQPGEAPSIDDGIPCTNDACDERTDTITHSPVNARCDNGLFCDGAETCDVRRGCMEGEAPMIDDGVSCTNDSCDERTDRIIHAPQDSLCDNGLFCDGAETCDVQRDCQPGRAPVVDDGVSCTRDSCDERADRIIHTPVDSLCDNGLFCDGAETCDAQRDCQEGRAPVVDDGVSCTRDSCDERSDTIVHTPVDSLCDNGLFCDGAETCDVQRDCQEGRAPVIDDGIACTRDSCDERADRVIHTPVNSLCDNGLFCDGAETCNVQRGCEAGDAPVIDDGVSCTRDNCDERSDTIVHTPVNSLCDNGLFCDGTETCDVQRDCQPGTPPNIDDGVSCTNDNCDERSDTIVHTPVDSLCDNGLFCDGAETCDAQRDCQEGRAPVVDDGVSCTRDSCDERADRVIHTPIDSLCDNGLFCDGAETCDVQRDCQEGRAPVIDDGVACTRDSCDERADRVIHTPVNSVCDNGLFCDGAETCDVQRDCQPGTPPNVDDGVVCTRDSCDERSNTIIHTPVDSLCDNGLFCDGAETCDVQRDCQEGRAPVIDDGVACTRDSCDERADRVIHTPVNSLCDNGLFCDGAETCNVQRGCVEGIAPNTNDNIACTRDSCDERTDRIVHTPVNSVCDDNEPCNGNEVCLVNSGCSNGAPLPDGQQCLDRPYSICLGRECGASVCGDGYTDDNLEEECDDGNDNNNDGCNNECQLVDQNPKGGNYALEPSISHACLPELGERAVNFTFRNMLFTTERGSLFVEGSPQGSPGFNMSQNPVPNGNSFEVRRILVGEIPNCTVIYTLRGEFQSRERWTGVFTAIYDGQGCSLNGESRQPCPSRPFTRNVQGTLVDGQPSR